MTRTTWHKLLVKEREIYFTIFVNEDWQGRSHPLFFKAFERRFLGEPAVTKSDEMSYT
jgi:hypothetical protein